MNFWIWIILCLPFLANGDECKDKADKAFEKDIADNNCTDVNFSIPDQLEDMLNSKNNMSVLETFHEQKLVDDNVYNNETFCEEMMSSLKCLYKYALEHHPKCWNKKEKDEECALGKKRMDITKKWKICTKDADKWFNVKKGTVCDDSSALVFQVNMALLILNLFIAFRYKMTQHS